MTALHLMAQYLLKGNHTIQTKEGKITFVDGEMEWIIPTSLFRADVAGIKSDGSRFILEICVSNKLKEPKIKFLREHKIQSIEIDLTQVDPDIRSKELLELLINDVSKQTIISSPTQSQARLINLWLGRIAWVVAILAFIKIITGRNKIQNFKVVRR